MPREAISPELEMDFGDFVLRMVFDRLGSWLILQFWRILWQSSRFHFISFM